MGECCRWGWLVRKGDTPDEARIKTLVFPVALFAFLVYLFVMFDTLRSTRQLVHVIGSSLIILATALFIGGVLSNVVPVGYILDAGIALITMGVCATDLGNATSSSPFRSWAFVVLFLDAALVFKRYHMPRFIIPFVLVYQVALQVESVSRFGLFEAGYWGTAGVEISSCNCAT
eukprot:Hpha_TRINITY_DN15670_c3_g5::TRINITY_DN15670_c3_g5_i1::g.100604::m.100604